VQYQRKKCKEGRRGGKGCRNGRGIEEKVMIVVGNEQL
jgi:hypothetical protein